MKKKEKLRIYGIIVSKKRKILLFQILIDNQLPKNKNKIFTD